MATDLSFFRFVAANSCPRCTDQITSSVALKAEKQLFDRLAYLPLVGELLEKIIAVPLNLKSDESAEKTNRHNGL